MTRATERADAILVERARALADLRALADDAVRGRGGVAVVRGRAGMGRSALLRGVGESLQGFTVLRARCAEFERDYELGVVRQLLEPLVAAAGPQQRESWFEGAASGVRDLLTASGRSATDLEPGFGVAHGLYWLVANVARDAPVALLLDDVDWADEESMRFFGFLSGRLDELPVLVVATAWQEADRARAEWFRAASVVDVPLSPLTLEGSHAVLAGLLPVPPSEAVARACHDATGGVPADLVSLAAILREAGEIGDTEALALLADAAPHDVVHRALRALDASVRPTAVTLCGALAVLDSDPSPDLVAATADVPWSVAERVCASLRRRDVVAPDRLALTHPLLGGAVLRELGPVETAAMHRRAARFLADRGSLDKAAFHLHHVPADADVWVTRVLVDASDAATRRHAAREAARHLERAAQQARETHPADLDHVYGRALHACADPRAVEVLRRAADASPDAPWWCEAVRTLAQAVAFTGDLAAAADTVHAAAARAVRRSDRLELEVDEYFYLIVTDRTGEVVEFGERLLGELDDAGLSSRGVLRGALALHGVHRNEDARGVADRAREGWLLGAGQPDPVHRRADAVMALALCGEVAAARSAAEEILGEAERHGSQAALAVGHVVRAMAQVGAGALPDAETDLREALRHAADALPLATPVAWELLCRVLLARHGDAALDEVRAMRPSLEGLPSGPADHVRLGSGRLAARAGDHRSAIGWYETVGENLRSRGGHGLAQLPWRHHAVISALAVDDVDHALALADEEGELARQFGAPLTLSMALRSAARVAAVRGDSDHAQRCLGEAHALVTPTAHALERARVALSLGEVLARRGARDRARDLLTEGVDLADRCAAAPLRDGGLALLRGMGARPRRMRSAGPQSLTASELRVCRLAAQGMTNRDVAMRLYVTPKTVELHLTNAYRKLGISSRSELATALAG